jgi:hypothetical protein
VLEKLQVVVIRGDTWVRGRPAIHAGQSHPPHHIIGGGA